MQLSAIALTAVLVLTGPQPESRSSDPGVIEVCMTMPLHKAKVSAEEAGTVTVLDAIEGQHVHKGDLLALIDDSQAKVQKKVAEYKLKAAQAEAKNKVNLQFAEASHAVAIAELDGMREANNSSGRKVFPASDLRKAELEVKKTGFQIEQAEQDQITAALKADVQLGELEAADLQLKRRKLLSPLEGEVVERHVHADEWVHAGDPIVTVIAMDRLSVEAPVDSTRLSQAEVKGKRVTVEARLAHGRTERFDGKVYGVSPRLDNRKEFLVYVEVYNRQENDTWLLSANMDVRMTIHWQEPKAP